MITNGLVPVRWTAAMRDGSVDDIVSAWLGRMAAERFKFDPHANKEAIYAVPP